ncbi:MAG: hypothetical protein J2P36_38165 [Ktedonobacteraceae bacterium]|nr:hypothetical protein [Ktedonobacteraceae bacterium]
MSGLWGGHEEATPRERCSLTTRDDREDHFSPAPLPASHPLLWGDWQRCFHRRKVVKLLRHQRVDIELAETSLPVQPPPIRLISRAERAHYRLSWAKRLAHNARGSAAPNISIRLFGIPDAFAAALGLRIA